MMILSVLFLLLPFCFCDYECGADLKPKKLAVVGVWTRRFDNATSQYRISDEDLSVRGYERSNTDKASSTVMLARHPEGCIVPSCGVRLTAMIQRNGAILHTDNALLRKNSQVMENIEDEFYCAQSNGSCGADVPVYRLVKHTLDGPHYAYSFDTSGQSLPGYEKEFFPICYAWRQTASVVLFNSTDDQLCLTITPINNNSHIIYNTHTSSMLFYPIGTTAALNCPPGYIGTGPSNIVCTKNGWYPRIGLGQCVKQHLLILGASSLPQHDSVSTDSCLIPTSIPNGNIVYSANIANISITSLVPTATRASVLCNVGFVPSTSVTSSKCIDSIWQPTLPTCLSIFNVKCPIMSSPMNAELVFSNSSADPYSIGSVINLVCNRNYFGMGNMSSECVAGGWNRKLGKCEPVGYRRSRTRVRRQVTSGAACSALSTPTYGSILYMQSNIATLYSSGTTGYLMCNFGYTLSGSVSSLCTNGAWSPTIGTCATTTSSTSSTGSCSLSTVLNGAITYSTGTIFDTTRASGTVATLTCNLGYSSSGTTSSTCTSGTWYPALGTCNSSTLASTTSNCTDPTVTYGTITYSSGTSSTTTKTSGTTATLTCNSGYSSSGTTSSTCLSGTWFPALGTCTTASTTGSCTDPSVTYGTITYSSGTSSTTTKTSGTTATLTCNSGYTASGTTTATCLSGTWFPTLGTCGTTSTTGTCTTPSVTYGTITYSSGTSSTSTQASGVVATLTCSSGYTASGTTSSTCLSGTWFPALGTCNTTSTIGSCTDPSVTYGTITYSSGTSSTSTKTSGTVATLTCSSGYSSSGTTSSTCLSGTWFPALGTCTTASTTGACTNPSVTYGTITYSSGTSSTTTKTSGTTATLTCNSGYTSSGTTSSTCLSGTWFPTFGTCASSTTTTCTNPTVLYGVITYSSGTALETTKTSGTVATLTCDTGFTTSGTTSSTCTSGTWYPSLGTCALGTSSSTGTNCTNPTVTYGTITYSSGTSSTTTKTSGTTATLTCSSGYSSSGTTSSTCLSGTWFPALGTCTTASTTGSCTDPTVTYGTITYSSGTSSTTTKTSGTTATLTCNSGYTASGTTTATCLSGTWFPTLGTCGTTSTTGTCTTPSVTYGTITYSSGTSSTSTQASGVVATLTCSSGYTASGTTSSTCLSGTWFPALGTCTSSSTTGSCTVPTVTNGVVTTNQGNFWETTRVSGTTATVTCNLGYTLSGNSQTICESGTWSPTLGTCALTSTSSSGSLQCAMMLAPLYGTVSYSSGGTIGPFSSGTVATATCTTGTISGTSTATCTNGMWSPTYFGTCSLTSTTTTGNCSAMTVPTGAQATYIPLSLSTTSFTSGTIATVTCTSTGTLLGTATCSSGTWSNTITSSCTSTGSCSSLTVPTGETVLYNNSISLLTTFTSGTVAKVECSNGTVLATTTCYSGTWTPTITTSCSGSSTSCSTAPTYPTGATITYSSGYFAPWTSGSTATMTCPLGQTASGTTISYCTSGTWSPAFGTCTSSTSSISSGCTPLNVLSGTVTNGQMTYSPALSSLVPIGTSISIVCNSGYSIQGISYSTCTSSGWSPSSVGSCVSSSLSCLALATPTYGTLTYSNTSTTLSYSSGTAVSLTCPTSYTATGGSTYSICQNGVWTPSSLATCQVTSASAAIGTSSVTSCVLGIGSVLNGNVAYSNNSPLGPYPQLTVATATCSTGYVASGTMSSTCVNGAWSPTTLGTCTLSSLSSLTGSTTSLTCAQMAAPVSGSLVYSALGNGPYASGTTATVLCNIGMKLSGTATSTCTNGLWTPLPGICISALLRKPDDNNRITEEDDPNKMLNTLERIAGDVCPPPIAPAFGEITFSEQSVNHTFAEGTTAALRCNLAYKTTGSTFSTCRRGSFRPIMGKCKQSDDLEQSGICVPLSPPKNSRIVYIQTGASLDFEDGTTALLYCEEGYAVTGTATLQCHGGQWEPASGFGMCDNI